MPSKPKRPCKKLGCPNLCDSGSGYCAGHDHLDARKQYDKTRRPDYRRLYNTAEWQRIRQRVLIEHPFCVLCEAQGIVTKATDIDHILDHIGDTMLFYKLDNLQPLCKACHGSKTALSRGFAKKIQ